MYIFALINLLEMQMDRLIRMCYGEDDWCSYLEQKRIDNAADLLEERRRANEALQLLDCLQFCDKRDLILRVPGLVLQLGLERRKNAERVFRRIEALRNRIAHAQDLIEGITWGDLFVLTETMDSLIRRCETLSPDHRLGTLEMA